jgi:two-component system phosphate regulon sensor histidine kinase PhoR
VRAHALNPGKTNLLGLAPPELEAFVSGLGEPSYRARQLMTWIYKRRIGDFAAMTELGKELRTRITVIDSSGIVLADSDENPRIMENHKNRPEVSEALVGGVGRSTRFSSTTNQEAVYVALPIGEEGRPAGVLRVSLFLTDSRFPPGLTGRMVRIGLLLSFLALVAAYLISRSISRPIKDLTAASERLAAGDFDTRVFLRRNDEFQALADTFNSMSREIKTAFEELNRQRAELKSIIDSLREGLVVIGK